MLTAMALWKRLDAAGHDTCRLFQGAHGWWLDGAAIFLYKGQPAHIAYQVVCDQSWVTQQGHVLGWIGEHTVDYRITRKVEGLWTLNEQPAMHSLHSGLISEVF